ncbi:metallophosphoesterase family protein [Mesotoga prima]|uniref:metallophosphoesterase family protein n=1 Tax=Mesotoga prima TaxID=1184387 RepID=UPI002B712A01|nr:metallophosphoesterase family protein [Mesotoga prima]HQN61686.1 metallophosphoesterase family protein [Mesotoga prima]
MKVFVISDTHFDHKNIIAYTNRPFPDVETMNQKLIDRWNETVAEGDLVYFLGDFCMRPKQNARRFRSLLNGSIILIKGNHDGKAAIYLEAGFLEVHKRLVIEHPERNDVKILLTHRAQPNPGADIALNIHGHIHDSALSGENYTGRYFNVSVENIGYRPVELRRLLELAGI